MGNLICGCLAIYLLPDMRSVDLFVILILLAAVFDLFDGLLARLLGVAGPMGKQLDSLADAVTFGIAPALLTVQMLDEQGAGSLAFGGLILAMASIYRLAKFNVAEDQSDQFKGLPTPANALFWISIAVMYDSGISWMSDLSPFITLSVVVLMSLWMISNIPLLALKFKSLDFSENLGRYVLLITAVVVIILMKILQDSYFAAVPIILLLYLLISLWDERRKKNHEVSR